MKYRQQITQEVRVAYVMMVYFIHREAAWRKVPRAAHFCAATRAWCRSLVVVARECRGAKLDYFVIFDFAKTLEEIIALRNAIF